MIVHQYLLSCCLHSGGINLHLLHHWKPEIIFAQKFRCHYYMIHVCMVFKSPIKMLTVHILQIITISNKLQHSFERIQRMHFHDVLIFSAIQTASKQYQFSCLLVFWNFLCSEYFLNELYMYCHHSDKK